MHTLVEDLAFYIMEQARKKRVTVTPKPKGFRAQLRGVQDLPFFMFRASMIFG